MPPAGSASGRLGADDWVRAAFDIMIDDGIAGVKVPRLCERLGVTKGSFYWHFDDLDAFYGELLRRWAADRPQPAALETEPEKVMLHAMEVAAEPRSRNLTRAMRDWAQHDERARAAVRKADQSSFARVKQAIAALGFSDEEAEVRAKILYYTGVGFAHVGPLGRRPSGREQLVATWEILTRR